MRVARPPVAGSTQMLPCRSMASVWPSGETATDIDVPSWTITSIGADSDGALACATWARSLGAGRLACVATLRATTKLSNASSGVLQLMCVLQAMHDDAVSTVERRFEGR